VRRSAKRYIYFWVDGIHVRARLEDTAQWLLIIIGATSEGRKELSASATVYAKVRNVGGNCSSM
jgi:transposase-like protein